MRGTVESESDAISQACKLQERLGLQAYLRIGLVNGNADAVVIVLNRVLDEIDLLKNELTG